MGAWGPGIFDDDTALDVRGTFEDVLENGGTVESATDEVLRQYTAELGDPDNGPVVRLALAALQAELGQLKPEVLQRAIAIIDEGEGLMVWEEQGADAVAERQQVLQDLRSKLTSIHSKDAASSVGTRRTRLRIGDWVSIPLPDGRKAYGQYVYRDRIMNTIVRISDLTTRDEVSVDRLKEAGEMFPPVSVAIERAVRDGRWRVIGNSPVRGFVFPKFRASSDGRPGVTHKWWLYDGHRDVFIGDLLAEYRSLEYRVLWSYPSLEDRIASGVNPYDNLL